MNLLFPLYLLGALAVAAPIYLHLKRKPPSDKVDFSSLRFLKPQRKVRINRQSKLEQLALLCLRSLALLLLAFVFARPFSKDASKDADALTLRRVVLIDSSASMQRAGMMDEARDEALNIAKECKDGDELAILNFDRAPATRLDLATYRDALPDEKPGLVDTTLNAIKPSWFNTDIGMALSAAIDVLQEAEAGDDAGSADLQEIVLISDMQEGAQLSAIEEVEWPEGVALRRILIEPKQTGNVSISLLKSVQQTQPLIRIAADDDFVGTTVELIWNETNRIPVQVAAGSQRSIPLPDEADRSQPIRLSINGDSDPFDNQLTLPAEQASRPAFAYLGPQKRNDSGTAFFYLTRAFAPTKQLDIQFQSSIEGADYLLMEGLPPAEQHNEISTYLEAGGDALLVLSKDVDDSAIKAISGHDLRIKELRIDDYLMLERLDFDHPVLSIFSEKKTRDFSMIHFWKARQIENLPEKAEVLARFDNGSPAWMRIPCGDGWLTVFAGGWHPSDSQLARSSKFIPLMDSIFEQAGLRTSAHASFTVGQSLHDQTEAWTGPSGEEVELNQGSLLFSEPGLYQSDARSISVQLAARESLLNPLPASRLEELGSTSQTNPSEDRESAEAAMTRGRELENEAQQKFWRWLVLGIFLILLLETALASRTPFESSDIEVTA